MGRAARCRPRRAGRWGRPAWEPRRPPWPRCSPPHAPAARSRTVTFSRGRCPAAPATSRGHGGRVALAALLPCSRTRRRRAGRRGGRPAGVLGADCGFEDDELDALGKAAFGRLVTLAHPDTDDPDALLVAAQLNAAWWAADDYYADDTALGAVPKLLPPRLALVIRHGPGPLGGRLHRSAERGTAGRPDTQNARLGRPASQPARHTGAGPAHLLFDVRHVRELDGLRGLAGDRRASTGVGVPGGTPARQLLHVHDAHRRRRRLRGSGAPVLRAARPPRRVPGGHRERPRQRSAFGGQGRRGREPRLQHRPADRRRPGLLGRGGDRDHRGPAQRPRPRLRGGPSGPRGRPVPGTPAVPARTAGLDGRRLRMARHQPRTPERTRLPPGRSSPGRETAAGSEALLQQFLALFGALAALSCARRKKSASSGSSARSASSM